MKRCAWDRSATSYFPSQWAEVKDAFEELKRGSRPTSSSPTPGTTATRTTGSSRELTWNTLRNHLVLEYEIPKYDGDLGAPNVFVPIPDDLSLEKVRLLTKHFQTQANKHWFSDDLFLSLMRIRGVECASRYAEAFYGRKVVIE